MIIIFGLKYDYSLHIKNVLKFILDLQVYLKRHITNRSSKNLLGTNNFNYKRIQHAYYK
mgnify:CR=1 FL=1